ncbi:MAG: Penicillin-binding protein 2D [Gemmatimonadaceae bacterium]|nr:Penicillin-binding protein 2D [Gemmatimonadaceae bacterium]
MAVAALAAGTGARAQDTTATGTGPAWSIVTPKQSSLVYARDGSPIWEIGTEWRTNVAIRTLPAHVGQAFVAVEDQRFYQHDGVDIVGIAGAVKDNLLGARRGASTITQQLVGNMHPDLVDRSDRSLGRKLREQAAAREMERHYTKEQILEAYLNQIHFGSRWYGIESAARHYFGKPAAQLTLVEAATLAALPKGPALYDPNRHPERALARRNLVLALMAQQGFITSAQKIVAQAEPLVTAKNAGFSEPAPNFVDVVRIQAERARIPVTTGGYRIHTTLDPSLQRAANVALSEGLLELEGRAGYRNPKYLGRARRSTDYLQGAVVALDPYTGDVRALVGTRDYNDSQYDRAVNAMRQPGSAFKPIVYTTAIAESLAANTVVEDTALAVVLPNRAVYRPENADGEFLGPLTLRDALAKSRNPVAVQLGLKLGMDSVIAMARRMGISSFIAPYPSSAIGASVVQPLDLVAAYATLDNGGARIEARFITRIEDRDGRVVWQNPIVQPQQVMDPKVAFIVRDMMRDVVDRGTATAVRSIVGDIPVAGKTGTTNDNADVWFVGMTQDLVAGVWIGFDRPRTIAPGAGGGSLAAPIWARMIATAGAGRGGAPWVVPDGLLSAELDRATGTLADSTTPPERRYTEYFLAGTEPLPLRLDTWQLFRGEGRGSR